MNHGLDSEYLLIVLARLIIFSALFIYHPQIVERPSHRKVRIPIGMHVSQQLVIHVPEVLEFVYKFLRFLHCCINFLNFLKIFD